MSTLFNALLPAWQKPEPRLEAFAHTIRYWEIAPSLRGQEASLVHKCHGGVPAVVCDTNTQEALGGRVAAALGVTPHLLAGTPEPTLASARALAADTGDASLLVAVGSGVISDLCKYASFLAGKPYVVFPTAPSMNGYLSANASLVEGGIKKSYAAHLPIGIFVDLDVLAHAPLRLVQSGVGDALCRVTAQADWLLSHLLLGTHYDPLPFAMLERSEAELFSQAGQLLRKDMRAMEALLANLLLSGLGMTLCGGSYPASQGEHLIAHAMEALYPETASHFHGEQIGVCTLLMAELQQKLLAVKDFTPLNAYIVPTAGAEPSFHAKQQLVAERGRALQSEWPTIRQKITAAAKADVSTLHGVLEAIHAPTQPRDLGWTDAMTKKAVYAAPFLRDRFTFLDLAHLTGNL